MKILFLALSKLDTIYGPGIYTDLMRQFVKDGHEVYVVSADEQEEKEPYTLKHEKGANIMTVRTGKIQQTGMLKKGINTILLEKRFLSAIQKGFPDVTFDIIMYPTPPITFVGVAERLKKRDKAKTILLLKDIFPQNAVDLGMMSTSGLKGVLYRYFRGKEQRLYCISDYIGCMSPANVAYLLKHNADVNPEKVGVFPNSIEVCDKSVTSEERDSIRRKYGIPGNQKVLVYGGNLGKPQGIPFLIQCLDACRELDCFFLIVGDGTEYHLLEEYCVTSGQKNVCLMKRMPKADYDVMVAACDVGMIFLDHRFTIPNFPSRLLSYLQAGLPVLACTDPNSDIGAVITEGGFGWWCESNDVKGFVAMVASIIKEDLQPEKEKAWEYLNSSANVEIEYRKMMDTVGEK